jgi:anti-sigma factor RsiW
MTQCWSEGELRAYLDGELPARDVERVAAHLKDCQACGRVCAELSGRAARIAAWLEAIPQLPPPSKIPAMRRSARHTGRWVAAAGLAAALALALVTASLQSRRGTKPAPPPQTAAKIAPAPAAVAPPARPLEVKPAIVRRRLPAKPKPRVEYYVALDDEPIEAGVVVRVGFSGGQVPADVIFGPDGRARAIRLVNDMSGEQ